MSSWILAATLLVKVTLILGAGALLAHLLRRRSAAARHAVWTLTLAGCAALALLTPLVPRLDLALPLPVAMEPGDAVDPARSSAAAASPGAAFPATGGPDPAPSPAARAAGDRPSEPALRPAAAAAWIWVLGSLAVLAWSAAGHLGLRRLARSASPLEAGPWPELLRQAAAASGVTRPIELRSSPAIATPLTWGARRPRVLLPAEADGWPRERQRAALLHELAHVERGDYLAQLAGLLACSLYWFHPGAWMALRRLRRESERACDDRVLLLGTPAAEYASQLLAVAHGANARRFAGAGLAIGMARPSTLEHRLLAVLDEGLPRQAVARPARLAAAVVLCAALVPLAGLGAAPSGAPVFGYGPRWSDGGEGLAAPGGEASGSRKPAGSVRAAGGERAAPGCSTDAGAHFECGLAAQPGEVLVLDLETGAEVEITGWGEPRVAMVARLSATDLEGNRAELRREAGGLRLRSWYSGSRRSWSSSHRFVLKVPDHFDVQVDSAGGDLTITGVDGTFRGQLGGGALVLTDLRGHAELATGGGEVRVTDSHLSGSVTTGGGMVLMSRVSGGLDADSGSGPVIYSESPGGGDGATGDLESLVIDRSRSRIRPPRGTAGLLHVEKAGGDISLVEAPAGARVTTGGGSISIGNAAGEVYAETGGGPIEIGPVAGSVRAQTGAGDIEVTLVDARGETQVVEIWSGQGDVVLVLPADFDGTVELETAYTRGFGRTTRIESDWTLERETTEWLDRWDEREGTPRRYVRARGTLGDGRGRVTVRTINGDIEIRRGR